MDQRRHPRLFSALATVIGVIALPVAAQPSAPASRNIPATPRPAATWKLETAVTGKTTFEARGDSAGGISVAQFGAELGVPLAPVAGRFGTDVSLRYRHYSVDRDTGTPVPDEFTSLSTALTVFSPLGAKGSLLVRASLGFHHAGSHLSSKGFGAGMLGLASRKFTPDFGAGLGLVYNSLSKGTGRVIPVATFHWTPAPAWRVSLGFPRTGVVYRHADDLDIEFTAEADFGSFYVTEDPLPGGHDKPSLDRTRLEYRSVRIGPAVTWRASSALSVRASAGAVPLLHVDYHQRQYRVKSEDVSPFASAAIEWRF